MAVSQGLGDGYALYNGVKLPNIDSVWTEEVKETHPYAYICYHVKRDRYELYFAEKWASGLEPGIVYATPDSSYLYTFGIMNNAEVYYLSGDSWVFYTSHSATGPVANRMRNNSPTWSNVTIYADSSLSSIYFSATSPIPLDGMQVIEWDGDTTGLVNINNYYKVSDDILDPTRDFSFTLVTSNRAMFSGANKDMVDIIAGSIVAYSTLLYSVYADNEYGLEKGLYFVKDTNGNYLSLLAYTPAAEPEQPKWQFNLSDFLSGIAAGAASRGVLRRTPIAYLYNGVQLPGLPEWDKEKYPYAWIHQFNTANPSYVLRIASEPIVYKKPIYKDYYVYSMTGTGCIYNINDGVWEIFRSDVAFDNYFPESDVLFSWTNTDIINEEDGTIYLEASDPVPVYE